MVCFSLASFERKSTTAAPQAFSFRRASMTLTSCRSRVVLSTSTLAFFKALAERSFSFSDLCWRGRRLSELRFLVRLLVALNAAPRPIAAVVVQGTLHCIFDFSVILSFQIRCRGDAGRRRLLFRCVLLRREVLRLQDSSRRQGRVLVRARVQTLDRDGCVASTVEIEWPSQFLRLDMLECTRAGVFFCYVGTRQKVLVLAWRLCCS